MFSISTLELPLLDKTPIDNFANNIEIYSQLSEDQEGDDTNDDYNEKDENIYSNENNYNLVSSI